MNSKRTLRITAAGLLCALAVVGSFVSFPVFGSKCAPVQHMVNVLASILLGPWYSLGIAAVASLIRNLTGLGSLLAFPGSMFGALLSGIVYKYFGRPSLAVAGEVFGTSVIGGLAAYPIAIAFMGVSAAAVGFGAYIVPFLISTAAGAVIVGIIVFALKRNGTLDKMQARL